MTSHARGTTLVALALGVMTVAAAPREERAAAIQQELATLQAQLKANGGTYETWAEKLRPYQGKSAQVIQCDDLATLPEACRPFEVMVDLDRQLKARGIDLIVAIIPSKLCVYPDYLHIAPGQPARAPADRQVAMALKRLHQQLLEADVEVIDLYTAFQAARDKNRDEQLLVYANDSHWNNAGCRVAADSIAARLRRYDFVQAALARGNPFVHEQTSRSDGNKADPDIHVIRRRDGGAYQDAPRSPVLITGDSYALYNQHLQAHLSAQVAARIGLPVTLLAEEGLSYNLPVKLAGRPGWLADRRVVVWTFNDKMLPLASGRGGWVKAKLPAAEAGPADAAATGDAKVVTATIAEVSAPPPKDAPYPHYYLVAYAKDVDAVLHILAMRHRQILPAATLQPGDKIEVKLTPWKIVEKTHGRIQSGTLPTVELQITKPHYLAEMPGAPVLTAADLHRAGEE
jgi:hypothetical protein